MRTFSRFDALSKKLHIIGDKVSASKADTVTLPTMVMANSVNNAPVRPVRSAIGTYTAISTMVMAIIGDANCLADRKHASSRLAPSAISRLIFSTTIIASSTTSPVASTSASKVSRLIEKPHIQRMPNVPMRDSGMVTTGTNVARGERRKANTTSVTISRLSPNVFATSFMEERMESVRRTRCCLSILR